MTVKRADAGFTLLEMLVVLAILALAAAALSPALFKPTTQRSAGQTAVRLVAELRAARALAVSRNTESRLVIDAVERRYWSETAAGRDTVRALPDGVGVDMIVAANERPSPTVGSIRFYPTGGSTGGTLILTAGNRKAIVTVDWLTGRSQIERGLPGT